jgi:hypothetical protein
MRTGACRMNIIKRAVTVMICAWQLRLPRSVPRHARHMHLNIDTALLMTRNPLSTVEYKMKAIVKQCPDGTCKAVLDAALIELYGMPSPDSDITEIGLPQWQYTPQPGDSERGRPTVVQLPRTGAKSFMYLDHKPKCPPTFAKIYRGAELQARYRQLMGDRA